MKRGHGKARTPSPCFLHGEDDVRYLRLGRKNGVIFFFIFSDFNACNRSSEMVS